jgi:LAO/AO transport system kinase
MSNDLVQDLLNGSRRALARLLTHVENGDAAAAISQLFPHTGKAHIIGITGAPGTGKSSLVNTLAQAYRQQAKTVAIIAVDPTSPFSGGAILGDRIRMQDLYGDKGVFIRSMATRGSLGGLAQATRDAIRVVDAAGFDLVLVETVGAGQSEVDIVRTAQSTIVVEAPGLGDDVQAIKAGILEIADILVVNKADRAGSRSTMQALRAMLELGHPVARTQMIRHHGTLTDTASDTNTQASAWVPPIVQTVATSNQGIEDLIEAITAHQNYLNESDIGVELAQQRIQLELVDRLREALLRRVLADFPDENLAAIIDRVHTRELDPQQAVQLILQQTV